jgi:hypothetical protein
MDKKIKINYKGKKVNLDLFSSECLSRLNTRIKYIKILEENNYDWKDTHKLSKIWYNVIYYKTKYSSDIYNQVIKYNKILENK